MKLSGEFDGSAAMELIHLLEKCAKRHKRVLVHTESLSRMDLFGQEVFRKNFNDLNEVRNRLTFTGEYAHRISPEKDEYLYQHEIFFPSKGSNKISFLDREQSKRRAMET